jgi:hypothetical protein
VAYASDAGTPASATRARGWWPPSRAAGLPVVPVPGASSVTALLSACRRRARTALRVPRLPAGQGGRAPAGVEALRQEAAAVVLLEAPHRIAALAERWPRWASASSRGARTDQAVRGDRHAALRGFPAGCRLAAAQRGRVRAGAASRGGCERRRQALRVLRCCWPNCR